VIAPARQLAYEVVRATFEDGAHTERAFRDGAAVRRIGGRERAQAQRLAYGAVQRRGTSDAAIARLAERSPRLLDPPVLAALRLGLYELLFADATPDHAAVDQAVELTKRAGAAHASGLVNAVLRRAAREREALSRSLLGDDSTPDLAAIAHSVPPWLAAMWWEELGATDARALLTACNRPAEIAFRIDVGPGSPRDWRGARAPRSPGGPTDREGVITTLKDGGVEARAPRAPWPLAPPESIVVEGRIGELVPARVAAGELTPQSRGSAAVVEVLGPRPGEHVLDLCAGPGIKTGQIAERMEDRGEVMSIELEPGRAGEVAAQAERLGLRGISVIEADAARMGDAFDGGEAGVFDRVLVDPPCSDLGTLASRPDARWRKSPAQIERLAGTQEGILRAAARMVRAGGTLVYSTCTISRRENEEQVEALLRASAAGELPPLRADDLGATAPGLASAHDSRFLQLRPDRDCTTGFFIARLIRNDG
jgi:16S rRNA (cytosine967-C5)-methyltransferase